MQNSYMSENVIFNVGCVFIIGLLQFISRVSSVEMSDVISPRCQGGTEVPSITIILIIYQEARKEKFLWNLDLCEFVVHSRNTATACGRLTNYYAAVGGAVGLEGLGPAHWLLFPSHVTVQLVERILGSSLSHTHPVSSPERDTAGFLFCGHSPRTFCSRPDLEADVSDSECRRRKDKGRFFPSATVAPAAAAGPQGVSLKMWNAVFWSGDGRSCAAARLLVPTETHTHKQTQGLCVSLYLLFYLLVSVG